MGLLDLPAPLFAWLDQIMAMGLPGAIRLMVWAAIGGAVTLLLYRLLSPQAKIGRAKRAAREARQRLNEFDGELTDAGPLIRHQFVAAFKHIGLVVPSTLVAMLPLLALLVWLDTSYSHTYPSEGDTPKMVASPGGLDIEWAIIDDKAHINILEDNRLRAEFTLSAPVPVIEQRHWWNWLVANPLGYLPQESGIERVEIDLPQSSYLPVGPDWMRSWMAIFFPVMLIVSLFIYRWARIE
ncbi:hypothetical protein L861_07490 [Litchfieldella anticariensis FP35 = DSM 16096]|uniref:Uncharacterized protein n=1 Tax=Litchfieldella anticariensis (strain DSM 16096 / CECT 5854 / CIP 108499 / LMG 22089 / FP35) TaxID=1121939 RepID=S2KDQ8_LITA3|nr:hypothetical protein [Halomonas anticariensis]EPC00332.1 hypothetical protein L861_07490 [Halomonas anticariensis FP35 = DSM 16096]